MKDEYPANDAEYEDDTITEVQKDAHGNWSITRKTGGSLYVAHEGDDNGNGIVPHVGDTARFYVRGFGYPVRGLFLNGKRVFYRTPAEEQVRHGDGAAAGAGEGRRTARVGGRVVGCAAASGEGRRRMKYLLIGLVLVLGGGCCDTWERMEKKCWEECPTYGATFVRLHYSAKEECHESSYECWCRRGAEQGGGSEPLRIW